MFNLELDKTIVSSIPLITIPTKKEYTIDAIKEKLTDYYSITERENKTLEVSSSEFGTFYLVLSGGIRFFKTPPVAVKFFLLSPYFSF